MAAFAAGGKSFGSKVAKVLKASLLTTSGLALVAGGGLVLYRDGIRYPRMVSAFSSGYISTPAKIDQVQYFERPNVELDLMPALSSQATGRYHIIRGETGTGKSSSVIHVVKKLMFEQGDKGEGAPVYVRASEGIAIVDALAEAVNFHFDEHLNIAYLINVVFGIATAPGKDEHHRLGRVLFAIEEAGRRYAEKNHKPIVLIIDGIEHLCQHLPGGVEKIQAKAKLWADTGIAKVVFVTSEELFLHKDTCNWSRADTPVDVGDLDAVSAVTMLTTNLAMCSSDAISVWSTPHDHSATDILEEQDAAQACGLVGGRVLDLLAFKYDKAAGVPFSSTCNRLKQKEREKFHTLHERKEIRPALKKLLDDKTRCMALAEFTTIAGGANIKSLLEANIIRLDRGKFEPIVKFSSKLTENVVDEFISNKAMVIY